MIIEPPLQKELIQGLTDKLKACYIFPDIADKICARLQKHLENGEYADITEGEFFAYWTSWDGIDDEMHRTYLQKFLGLVGQRCTSAQPSVIAVKPS